MADDLLRVYSPAECGPDGYPLAWHFTIKHLVRAQSGYRCVRCHHPYVNGANGKGEWSRCDAQCDHAGPFRVLGGGQRVWPGAAEWVLVDPGPPAREFFGAGRVEARWRILTVHHADGDKRNCRWWNLLPLCQRCHLTVQGKVRLERTWPWQHTEWFRPYVAGYYAWAYLGEDLSREETEARLGELLALELVAPGGEVPKP